MLYKFIRIIGFYILALLSSCSTLPEPTITYEDTWFTIPPIIVKRDENYYLKYRIKLLDDLNLRHVLVAKEGNKKGYYYFTGPISSFEYGNTVERPLVIDGFTEYAKVDSIYWLDPNGNETHIKIIEENEYTNSN